MKNYLHSKIYSGQSFLKSIFITVFLTAISLTGFGQLPTGWEINPPSFEYDGDVNVKVVINDVYITSGGTLAAFVGEECRGLAEGYYNPLRTFIFTIRVYSNSGSDETVNFKFFDPNTQQITDIDQTIQFSSNMVIGSIFVPEIFTGSTYIEPNNNASLFDLLVDGTTVDDFNPDILIYNLELPFGTSVVPIVTAIATDQNAAIVITDATQLPGSTTVVVTAEDGETVLTYTVNFTIGLNNDATLSDLLLNGTTIENFDPATLNYYVSLPYGTIIVPSVTATQTDLNAGVQITPTNEIPGITIIKVTAEDGKTVQIYSVEFVFLQNENPVLTKIGAQSTPEDTPLQLNVEFTDDPAETQFTVTVVSDNENVIVEGLNKKSTIYPYTLNPALDFNGTANITVKVKDERGGSDTETYILTITAVNDAPVLTKVGRSTTNEETTKTLAVDFTDPDEGDTHTITVVSDNANVLVENLSGQISGSTYNLIPANAWNGSANITVTVTDNSGEANNSDTETYVLSVTNNNDAPNLTPVGNQEIAEDTYIDLEVNFTDDDTADTHTITIESDEENVTIENLSGDVSGSTYRLVPAENWNGQANITVSVIDAIGASDTETFVLTVSSVNDSPILTNIPGQTIIEGEFFTPIDLNQYVTDVDNTLEEIEWTYTGNTELLVSIIEKVAFIVAPDENWNGSETVMFIVTDPNGLKASDAATFTVTAFNDPPIIADIPDQTLAEGSIFATINLDDFISDEETPDSQIQWSFTGNIELSVSIDNDRVASITAPNINWFGSETISFIALDEGGKTAQDAAVFTFTSVNDIPVLLSIPSQTIPEGGSFQQIDLNKIIDDVETPDNEIEWLVQSKPDVFEIEIIDGIAIITITDENWFGEEIVQFKATDGDGAQVYASVNLIVTPVNDPPVIIDIPNQTIAEGEVFAAIHLNEFITDIEDDPTDIIWTAVSTAHLNVIIVNNIATVEVTDPEWNGAETIFFVATDLGGLTATDKAIFTVTAVNDPPIVTQIPPQETTEGTNFAPFSLNAYVEDAETPDSQIKWTTSIAQFLIVNIDPAKNASVMVKNKDWYGQETIKFTATDQAGASSFVNVIFNVTPVNDAPVVSVIPNQTIIEGQVFSAINLINHVIDVDINDVITWKYAGNTELTVTIINNIATITIPNENWNGFETIRFTAEDEGGLSSFADVKFTVSPVNDTPVAEAIPNQIIAEGGTFANIDLKNYFEDVETADNLFEWSVTEVAPDKSTLGEALDITVSTDGIVSISILDENWNGQEEYTFTAKDEGGLTASSNILFEVTPINDPPMVIAPMGTKNKAEDFAEFLIDLTKVFSDVDNEVLIYEIVSVVPAGIATAEIFEGNKLKLTSITNASGQTLITVKATEDGVSPQMVQDILTLNVSTANDPPVIGTAMGTVNKDEDFAAFNIDLKTVFTDSDGEDLIFAITQITGTSVTGNIIGNILTVKPIKDKFSNGNTITVSATDGFGESVSDILTVNVSPINDAPIITGQAVLSTLEDIPFELLLTHLTVIDPDNNYPADFTMFVGGGANYSVNGQTIIPAINYFGTLTIPVMVNDGFLTSNLFNVRMTVGPVNDRPLITPIGAQLMDEDTRLKLNLKFTDGDVNNTHTLQITSNKPDVSIVYNQTVNQNVISVFEIVPNPNWFGTANITVNVTDNSEADNNLGTIGFVLTVKNVNDKPLIITQTIGAATQEQLYSTTLNFTDIDSPNLTFSVSSSPSWLTLGTSGPLAVVDNQASITLQGTPGPSVRDFLLSVKISDGALSSTASYNLKVNQINYPPVVQNANYDVTEDTPKLITLVGSDNETPFADLIFAIPTPPSHGSLVLDPTTKNVYKYIPNADYFGADFFTYSVTDGAAKTSTARIDLNVLFVNDKPVISANLASYTTTQNTPFTIILSANDNKDGANAAPLNFVIASAPVNGILTATATPGSYTYTPTTNFYGNDKVIFRAVETGQNPNLASADLSRIITVTRVNKAPIAYDRTQLVNEDKLIVFNLLASDDKTDILNLEYQIVSLPTHAKTFIINKNEAKYQAVENYNGTDQFTFRVKDEDGAWSGIATVNINIAAVNDVPVGRDIIIPAADATSVLIDFADLITDPDTDFDHLVLEFTLEASLGSAGALGGTLTHVDGSIYQFNQGALGLADDVVLWRVKEGSYASPFYTAQITGLHLASGKRAEAGRVFANPTSYNVNFGNSILVEFVGLDLQSPYEQLTIAVTANPAHGTLSNFQFVEFSGITTKYSATFTPTDNATIQDIITFSVSDGVDTEYANITINITSTNIAPDLTDIDNVQMTEDTPVNINIPFTDPDTTPANLTWTFTSTPEVDGLVFTVLDASTSPASIGVTLPQDYTGSSTIEVKLEDNTDLFDNIDFTLTVDNVNDAPVLDPVDTQSSLEDEMFDFTFTADDVDTDNANLTYSAICNPAEAATSITFNGNEMTFTPAANYNGDVDITVTVEDNETPSLTNNLTFTLSIANQNDNPQLTTISNPAAIDEDSGVIEVKITPTDIDVADELTVTLESSNTTLFPTESMGVVQAVATTGVERTITLTPAENEFGTAVITVTVSDGDASAIQQFNVTVNEVNDKPVLEYIESITMEENTSVQVDIIASDVDSPTLTYDASSNNSDLTVSIVNNGGSYEMDVNAINNYNGSSQITVTIDDSQGGITQQIVDVEVTSVDQLPYLANPIDDINAEEDDANIIIPIGNVFDDPDNDNTLIELSIEGTPNPLLLTAEITGTNLTIDLLENKSGTATITIKGVSNGKTVYDEFTVTIAAVDDAPEVANPITDINAQEDDANIIIPIGSVFNDVDNENALIELSIEGTPNPLLLTASITGTNLTIDLIENAFGSATVTVKGLSNSKTAYDEFTVNVTNVDDAPELLNSIQDVEADMNDPDFEIDLTNVFTDIDNENTQITKAVINNTNSVLVTTSIFENTLTLSFANNQYGTADITVEATSNGKTVTDIFTVVVIDNTAIGDIDDLGYELSIYPNPSKGQFQVKINTLTNERFTISIFSLTGKIVYSEEFDKNSTEFIKEFNISEYGSGIYFFQIQTKSFKSYTQKIIVN